MKRTLQEYLVERYSGELINTMPGAESPNTDSIIKENNNPPSNNPFDKLLSEIVSAVETKKCDLGNRLIEDFRIENLEETPSTAELFRETLKYFDIEGYHQYGMRGRHEIIKNDEGEAFCFLVRVSNKYLCAQVQRVILKQK